VRFGGATVVATKYLDKDPEDMQTVYKIYDDHGRHVGSKREWARIQTLYPAKAVDKVQEHKSKLQKRKFYEMTRERRETRGRREEQQDGDSRTDDGQEPPRAATPVKVKRK
jgi:hypothetical protein